MFQSSSTTVFLLTILGLTSLPLAVFGAFHKRARVESALLKSLDDDQQPIDVQQSPNRVPQAVQPAGLINPGSGSANAGFGAKAPFPAAEGRGQPFGPPQFGGPPPEFDGVPPGFEKILPVDALEKMRTLARNQNMPIQQKQIEFDRIMSTVPANILAKLPLPPGFEALPESVQAQIRTIHGDDKLNWTQKSEKVHQLIQAQPPENQPRPPPGFPPPPPHRGGPRHRHQGDDFFPPNPPPGFEEVIPKDKYQQLLDIHRNRDLTPEQKGQQIDQLMRALPQDIIDRLPLPPGFDQLPEKELKKVRAIFGDRNLSFKEKDRKVFEYVKQLPLNLRRLVRPPLPPVFDRLAPETKDKIANLFDDDTMDDQLRQKRFWEMINGLPNNERAIVQEALKFPSKN